MLSKFGNYRKPQLFFLEVSDHEQSGHYSSWFGSLGFRYRISLAECSASNMKTVNYIILLIFIFCPTLQAESISTTPVTLNEILEIARKQNPELLAALSRWESARAKVLATKSWPDPQVGVEFWGFSRSGLNVGSAQEKWYDISQTIPFPGKLRLRGQAAHHEARREEGNYHTVEREIIAKAKEAYYQLLYANRSYQIYKGNVEIIRKFSKIAESKYAVGKASQSDVLRAQVELSKMLNMLVTMQQDQEIAQAKLNALLDRPLEELVGDPQEPSLEPFDYTYSDLEKIALENRPEIQAASHHLDHMKAELLAMKADYLPDTMVQYTIRTMEGRESDAIAFFKFNLPFVWFWRQGSLVKSTRNEKSHAEAMLRSIRTMTRYAIKEFLVHVQTSKRVVDLYKTSVIPQAEQSLKVAEAGYQSDKIDFLALLDSQRALVDFQIDYYKYLSDYGTNLAHLERILGKDFLEVVKK